MIRKLRRLRDEAPLLCRALSTVWLMRLALWVLPFGTLRDRLARMQPCAAPPVERPTPMHLAWTVVIASRFVPGASCLTQALSTDRLLKRYGYQGVLHIGVSLRDNGRLMAHAWLEYDGAIIIGGRGSGKYTAFPPIDIG